MLFAHQLCEKCMGLTRRFSPGALATTCDATESGATGLSCVGIVDAKAPVLLRSMAVFRAHLGTKTKTNKLHLPSVDMTYLSDPKEGGIFAGTGDPTTDSFGIC